MNHLISMYGSSSPSYLQKLQYKKYRIFSDPKNILFAIHLLV